MAAPRSNLRSRSAAIVSVALLASFGALLAIAPQAAAVTYVSGWISVDATWGIADSVYVVTRSVTVRPGATLTILPGTTVRFNGGTALYVEGALVANGLAASRISFVQNSSLVPAMWRGIQFNATAKGSVSWSSFDMVERAVVALDSSPAINNNTVLRSMIGFSLVRSSSVLADNSVERAVSAGVLLDGSNAQVVSNRINGTALGVSADVAGSPSIAFNTITNVSGGFAIGIQVRAAAADIRWNTLRSLSGARGPTGAVPGASGGGGGSRVRDLG